MSAALRRALRMAMRSAGNYGETRRHIGRMLRDNQVGGAAGGLAGYANAQEEGEDPLAATLWGMGLGGVAGVASGPLIRGAGRGMRRVGEMAQDAGMALRRRPMADEASDPRIADLMQQMEAARRAGDERSILRIRDEILSLLNGQ